MKPVIKNAVESALVALAVGLTCLWFLVSEANADDTSVLKIVLLAVGLGASVLVHLGWMLQAALRDGRRLWVWVLALVFAFPIGSVVLLTLLFAKRGDEGKAAAGAQPHAE